MRGHASVAALFCLFFAAGAAPASAEQWIGTWGAAPVQPAFLVTAAPPANPASPVPGAPAESAARPISPPASGPVSLNNETLRNVVRISAGGQRIRLRLTNEYGAAQLKIGAASVSLADASGAIVANTMRKVTFAGKSSAVIAAGAPLLSDPIYLPVKPLSTLSISVYFPEDTGPCTCHPAAQQTAYVSAPGDFTAADFQPARTLVARAFISGVDVEVKKGAAIVALGDSITDGTGSTAGANRRWPDRLAERLVESRPGEAWGVVNEGIGGNRVLAEGRGPSALARFDRDVLAQSGVAYVIVFEGINDLGRGFSMRPGAPVPATPEQKPTAEAMIAGYRQLIARAHARGVKVIGATIAPNQGAMSWSEEGEAQRTAINQWIRTGGEFDGVADFDAALRDPAAPLRIAEGKHAGDHLHGNDAGYLAVANAIDLRLFK